MRIATSDEAGKIDLNHAPPELLVTALVYAGVDEPAVLPLVDAILDWRDGDDPGIRVCRQGFSFD